MYFRIELEFCGGSQLVIIYPVDSSNCSLTSESQFYTNDVSFTHGHLYMDILGWNSTVLVQQRLSENWFGYNSAMMTSDLVHCTAGAHPMSVTSSLGLGKHSKVTVVV